MISIQAEWDLEDEESKLYREKTFSLEELFMSQEASNRHAGT